MTFNELSLDLHIGNVRRITKLKDLREWEIESLLNIVKNRPVRLGNSFDLNNFVSNMCLIVNDIITDKVLMSSRMRSRYLGADVGLDCKKPEYVRDDKWSNTLLQSFIRDWTGYVVVESLFSVKFKKDIECKKTHLKLFFKFVYERSIRNVFNKKDNKYSSCDISRSAIFWCKKNLDGQWKYREYGDSLTEKVLKKLPSFIAWSDAFLYKHTCFGNISNLKYGFKKLTGFYASLETEKNNEVLSKLKADIDIFLNGFEKMLTTRQNHLILNKTANGVDGILSKKFYESFLRNRDFCFIELVKFFIADAKKRNINNPCGYTINSNFYKMGIRSIINKSDFKKNNKYNNKLFDARRMFWNSIVYNFNEKNPISGSLSDDKELILFNKFYKKLISDYASLSIDDKKNIIKLSQNELYRYSSIGSMVKSVKPYQRIYCWNAPLLNLGRDTSNLFNIDGDSIMDFFSSKLTSENLFVLFDKILDMALSGTSLSIDYNNETEWMSILENALKFYTNKYKITDCENRKFHSNRSGHFLDYGLRARKDILESIVLKNNRWSKPYSLAIGGHSFKFNNFLDNYSKHFLFYVENIDGLKPKGYNEAPEYITEIMDNVIGVGCVNIKIWDLWNKFLSDFRISQLSVIDNRFAFLTFVARLGYWSPKVAKSILGLYYNYVDYDFKGFRWIPDFKNLTDIIDETDNKTEDFFGRVSNANRNDMSYLNVLRIKANEIRGSKKLEDILLLNKINRDINLTISDYQHRKNFIEECVKNNIKDDEIKTMLTKKTSSDFAKRHYQEKQFNKNEDDLLKSILNTI